MLTSTNADSLFHHDKTIVRWFVKLTLLKQLSEVGGDGGLEFQAFVRDGMPEAEYIGVEAKSADGVVAIAIFDVSADGVSNVGSVDSYLVLASRLQLIFHQRMFRRSV